MNQLANVIDMNLSNNNITSFEDNVFDESKSMETLIIRNNQILDVPRANLLSLVKLKTLDLSGNLIKTIKNDSFVTLLQLNEIDLSDNVIDTLEMRAFDGVSNLQTLNLADNNLSVSDSHNRIRTIGSDPLVAILF